MSQGSLEIPIAGGIIYADRTGVVRDAIPLLCVHGVGGHHGNFARLKLKLREHVPQVVTYLVDVPGFGNAQTAPLSLRQITSFLTTACDFIADECGRRIIILGESASVWFTVGLAGHSSVDSKVVITFNPVRIYRPSVTDIRRLLGENVVDLRHAFMSRFFPPERIEKMDSDELGRPSVTLSFLAELWKLQRVQPLAGWRRAVVIETNQDPMREFRISLMGIEMERYELESSQHGIGDDHLAAQTALIVQQVLRAER
jgi:pimeloyl-ACP methyl ester carboxylesterase